MRCYNIFGVALWLFWRQSRYRRIAASLAVHRNLKRFDWANIMVNQLNWYNLILRNSDFKWINQHKIKAWCRMPLQNTSVTALVMRVQGKSQLVLFMFRFMRWFDWSWTLDRFCEYCPLLKEEEYPNKCSCITMLTRYHAMHGLLNK